MTEKLKKGLCAVIKSRRISSEVASFSLHVRAMCSYSSALFKPVLLKTLKDDQLNIKVYIFVCVLKHLRK